MMALGPQELRGRISGSEIEQAEKRIDLALQLNYTPGVRDITVDIGTVHREVRQELIRRYEAAGWNGVVVLVGERQLLFIF